MIINQENVPELKVMSFQTKRTHETPIKIEIDKHDIISTQSTHENKDILQSFWNGREGEGRDDIRRIGHQNGFGLLTATLGAETIAEN